MASTRNCTIHVAGKDYKCEYKHAYFALNGLFKKDPWKNNECVFFLRSMDDRDCKMNFINE